MMNTPYVSFSSLDTLVGMRRLSVASAVALLVACAPLSKPLPGSEAVPPTAYAQVNQQLKESALPPLANRLPAEKRLPAFDGAPGKGTGPAPPDLFQGKNPAVARRARPAGQGPRPEHPGRSGRDGLGHGELPGRAPVASIRHPALQHWLLVGRGARHHPRARLDHPNIRGGLHPLSQQPG